MTDLIKNEAEFIRNCATDIETGEPLDDDQMCNLYVIDAHRIADLIDAVEERNKELTLQLLAVHGQAADALAKLTEQAARIQELEAACWQMKEDRDRAIGWRDHDKTRAETAEANLTKAVEALEEISRNANIIIARFARTTLAELEGGSEPDQKQSV